MLDIFKKKPRSFSGKLQSPEIPYLRRNLAIERNTVVEYYRGHYKRIAADNLLIKVIHCFALQSHLDDLEYADWVNNQFSSYARNLGFVTPYNKGRFHIKGILLGPETCEAIQHIVDADENYFDVDQKWTTLTPIQYLYHTRTDLTFPLMNNTTKGKGLGLLRLDVGMLMVKYRHWHREAKRQFGQPPSVAYFVGTYVIPDVIESYMDIALFNRLDVQYSHLPLRKYPAPHPFYVTNYTDRLDSLNKTVIEYCSNNELDFEQMLWNTPLIFKDNALSLVQPQEGITSRNNEWVYLLQILPYLSYLAKYRDKHALNNTYRQRLLNRLRYLERDHVFNGVGSADITTYLYQQLNQLITLLT